MIGPEITSVQNPRVKQLVKLRDQRGRARQERIVIDGPREVSRAVAAGVRLAELFICPALCRSAEARELCQQAQAGALGDAQIAPVTETVFAKLAYGERHDGVVAVAERPTARLDELRLPERPLVVVLAGVEKPGNVGAALRSADGAGASALVVADGATDLFNPNTIRASQGVIFSFPVVEATAAETLSWLRRRGLAMYAARPDAATVYTDAHLTGPAALILGSEAEGLDAVWQADDVHPIRLPMLGQSDSLNVSVTAAVLCYEALRQREAISN
ncbi:MAG: RNA methyltransferase [Planctomycetes bacterium]|nr:RNA methyltransferase [Planctomycetota bacterium]